MPLRPAHAGRYIIQVRLCASDRRDHSREVRPRDEIDALRLLAVFLAHWDNKAENQRLVCLDAGYRAGECRQPLLMIQDVGATFGPAKVNLSQWRQQPMWLNRGTCTVSMRAMPFGGSTFDDVRISDGARVQVGRAVAG